VGDFADDEDELKNTFKTEVRVMLRQMIQMAHMLHGQVMKGWKTTVDMSIVKDKEHTMAVIIKKASSEGAVRAFDKKRKMVTSIIIKPTQESTRKIEMRFSSSRCDALIRGRLLVRYVRKY